MLRWISILGALALSVFLGGVFYFSQSEKNVWHEFSGRMDGRGMPAVFNGFGERWNRAGERELRRELAEGGRKEKLLVVSRGEGDGRRLAEQARSVERIRKRLLLKDHIRLLPLEDVPDGLEWQTGMEEPDVGDPRADKG